MGKFDNVQSYSMLLIFCVTVVYCMLLKSCDFWKENETVQQQQPTTMYL